MVPTQEQFRVRLPPAAPSRGALADHPGTDRSHLATVAGIQDRLVIMQSLQVRRGPCPCSSLFLSFSGKMVVWPSCRACWNGPGAKCVCSLLLEQGTAVKSCWHDLHTCAAMQLVDLIAEAQEADAHRLRRCALLLPGQAQGRPAQGLQVGQMAMVNTHVHPV